jgi:hypothetical protein
LEEERAKRRAEAVTAQNIIDGKPPDAPAEKVEGEDGQKQKMMLKVGLNLTQKVV